MRSATIAVCLVLCATCARAGIVTSCSEPEGYAYYEKGPFVSKSKAGWVPDRITGGRYILTREGDELDIIYVDAAKRTVSSREDGGKVILVTDKPGTLVLIVNYPEMTIETWVFKIDRDGKGTVMVSMHRYGDSAMIKRTLVMRAPCAK